MERSFKNGKHSGYTISGGKIKIHNHLNDPDSWFLTIRDLSVHSEYLCSKDSTEKELARRVNFELAKIQKKLDLLTKDVLPLT